MKAQITDPDLYLVGHLQEYKCVVWLAVSF